MKISKLNFITLLSFMTLACTSAQSGGIKEPIDSKQRLSTNNINLTGEEFWEAYMSKNIKQRRYAEMYLAGVLDSSEGVRWCSYRIALPGSIQEQIFIGFKKVPTEEMSKRASKIIVSIVSNMLPCKETK